MITCGCNLFEWGTFLRRMDNFLMDIYSDEENVQALVEQLMERHLASLEKVCAAVGDIVDILRFGDDLGMTTDMFMSREKYQTLFKPYHTKLNEYVHTHSNMKTLLHSCGSLYPIIPDLIEAGYDVLNPVQTSARGMDPATLKREFGKDITFWGGGCDTKSVLNRGTPNEVFDHCRRMIEIFNKDGGFVFNQEHNILPDVPPENILAMYRAVRNY
jgi:uroporphyrinogen decarboxylase